MSDKPLPVLLVKPKTISRKDIDRAEKQGFLCIIECKEPESARFLEPPPDAGLDTQARAAISLMRMVLRQQSVDFKRGDLTKFFCEALLHEQQPVAIHPVKS